MHLVVRSTAAKGSRNFRQPHHFNRVNAILIKFAGKHGVHIWNHAVHTNHIHLHVQLSSPRGYKRFIRAVTSAIAWLVWKGRKKFWDRRPFSRIVRGRHEFAVMDDYIEINKIEVLGYTRAAARKILRRRREKEKPTLWAWVSSFRR